MADWREKLKTISNTKGESAPEPAKRLGIGCLAAVVLAVSILALIMAIGLFKSGSWVIGLFAGGFFLISAATAALLLLPHKPKPL